MIIRHGEKPGDVGPPDGVSPDGAQDAEDLLVRGWQRAGALGRFFAPASGKLDDERLVTPALIYASGIGPHSKSLRPQRTVSVVADLLGLQMNVAHLKGQEAALAADVVAHEEPVLIGWEHEAIPGIVNLIVGNNNTCPQTWSGERFDLVWVLDQAEPASGWTFTQVPQMLLPGDSDTPIA